MKRARGRSALSIVSCAPALAFILAVASPSLARAYCLMTTDSLNRDEAEGCTSDGDPLRWGGPCISLSLDERGSSDLDMATVRGAIERSFEAWTSVDCGGGHPAFNIRLNDAMTRCHVASFDLNGPNANTIAFVDNFEDEGYDESAFAVTIVWYSIDSGEIFDADMLINEDFTPYTICPESGCVGDVIDLENVITHEAGHFFGLAHSAEHLATMYSLAPRGEIQKRTLHSDDREGFCELYAESFERSCSYAPIGGLASRCAGEPEPKKSGRCDAGGAALGESLIPLLLGLLGLAAYRLWMRRRAAIA